MPAMPCYPVIVKLPDGGALVSTAASNVFTGTNTFNGPTVIAGTLTLPAITNNDALTQVIVRDPATNLLYWRSASSLGGGGGGGWPGENAVYSWTNQHTFYGDVYLSNDVFLAQPPPLNNAATQVVAIDGFNRAVLRDVSTLGGGGGGGHVIQENGVGLAARANLNFGNGLLAADNAGASRTDVTINPADTVSWTAIQNFQMLTAGLGVSANTLGFGGYGAISGALIATSAGRVLEIAGTDDINATGTAFNATFTSSSPKLSAVAVGDRLYVVSGGNSMIVEVTALALPAVTMRLLAGNAILYSSGSAMYNLGPVNSPILITAKSRFDLPSRLTAQATGISRVTLVHDGTVTAGSAAGILTTAVLEKAGDLQATYGFASGTLQPGVAFGAPTQAQLIFLPTVTRFRQVPQNDAYTQILAIDSGTGALGWRSAATLGGGGSSGYATVQEEGTALTVRTVLNFVGSAATAADDGANARTNVTFAAILNTIATNGGVSAAEIVDGAVGNAELRNSAGTSVIGRSAGTTGVPADIAASADGQFLRRSAGALAFAIPVAADISDFAEAVDDRVAALLVAGTNVTLNYNDAANSLTINAAGGGGGGGSTGIPLDPATARFWGTAFPGLGTLGAQRGLVLSYDGITDEEAFWEFEAPDGAWTTVTFSALLSSPVAVTGTARLQVAIQAVTAGDALNIGTATSFDTDIGIPVTIPASVNHVVRVTASMAAALDGIAPGDYVRLRVRRDADGTSGVDDVANDINFHVGTLRFS